MTIVEAVKNVLNSISDGLTTQEIYDEIIKRKLYKFGAKKPIEVVNAKIRRHCQGLDFPTAHPIKYFKIIKSYNQKAKFVLLKGNSAIEYIQEENLANMLPEEKIQHAYNEHLKILNAQVLDAVLSRNPEFFEKLVVELLLKIGLWIWSEFRDSNRWLS